MKCNRATSERPNWYLYGKIVYLEDAYQPNYVGRYLLLVVSIYSSTTDHLLRLFGALLGGMLT